MFRAAQVESRAIESIDLQVLYLSQRISINYTSKILGLLYLFIISHN